MNLDARIAIISIKQFYHRNARIIAIKHISVDWRINQRIEGVLYFSLKWDIYMILLIKLEFIKSY